MVINIYTKISTEECINRLGDFLKLLAIAEFYGICPTATIKAKKLVMMTHQKEPKKEQRAAECQKELERAKNSKKKAKRSQISQKKSKKDKISQKKQKKP
jgi:hypothetical protein